MNNTHKSGAGRKPLKPNYDAVAILQEQMQAAVALYNSNNSLQTIADTLSLNPIKVRKLLITAGVYESETADAVNSAFEAKQRIPYNDHPALSAALCTARYQHRRPRPVDHRVGQ